MEPFWPPIGDPPLEVVASELCSYDADLDQYTLTTATVASSYVALDHDIARSFNLSFTYTLGDAAGTSTGTGELVAQWGEAARYYQFIVTHGAGIAATYAVTWNDEDTTTVTQLATGTLAGFAYNEPQTVRLEVIFDTLFPYLTAHGSDATASEIVEVPVCEGVSLLAYQTIFSNGVLLFSATNTEATYTHVLDGIMCLPNLTITDPVVCTESFFAKEYLGLNWKSIADNPLPATFELPDGAETCNVYVTLGADNDANVAQLEVINANHMIVVGVGTDASAYLRTYTETGLALGTNGLDRIVVSASGNVGVGTENPQYSLHVSGGVYATSYHNVQWADIGGKPENLGGGIGENDEFVLCNDEVTAELPLGTAVTSMAKEALGDPTFMKSGTMVARNDYIALANKLGIPKSQATFMLPYPDVVETVTPWSQIVGKPDYFPADWNTTLANIPEWVTPAVKPDWNAASGSASEILNKPSLDGQWPTQANTTNIYYTAGNVGIGISAPTTKLQVAGDVTLAGKLTNEIYTYDYQHQWYANTYTQVGQTFPRLYQSSWLDSCWSPELGKLVVVGGYYTNQPNTIAVTTDLQGSFTPVNPGNTRDWNRVIWVAELALFVTVGWGDPTVMTSPDGYNWTSYTPAGTSGKVFKDIAWSSKLKLLVAVGSTNYFHTLTSPDGVNWTFNSPIASPVNYEQLRSIAWSPELNLFVTLATNGTRGFISTNGVNWTTVTVPDSNWTSVCWVPSKLPERLGKFVAVGATGSTRVIVSNDGVNWYGYSSPLHTWNKVIWAEEPAVLVATADFPYNGSGPFLMTSPNGYTWTARSVGGSYPLYGVSWCPAQLRFFLVSNSVYPYSFISFVDKYTHRLKHDTGTFSLFSTLDTQLQLDLNKDNARKLTTSTWTTGSDRRLKTDITVADYDTCYSNMKAIDLVRFAWDSNIPAYADVADRHKLGWIAQDVQSVFSKAVTERPFEHGMSNVLNLNTDQIYAMMYGTIRKLQDDVEKLKLAIQ